MPELIGEDKYRQFGHVIATNRVTKERCGIRFMYREVPDSTADSGWRFFAGTEDQTYTDNPDNLALYSITTILKIDPSIESYLGTPSPCCFERENDDADFVRNDAYAFQPEQ